MAADDPKWAAEVRERLLAWFAVARRSLPWRDDRDPYRVLVSEMMLVQTTVAAVIPHFGRFVARYPDFATLAAADGDEVLKSWEGLGYYRRARHLHAAARAVVAEHGGRMPRDPAAVRALPGVGRYLAGAVLSQAFDLPEPILEANSRRVLARLRGETGDLAGAGAQTRLWDVAARLVAGERAGDFNQSLMELGALVCVAREPRCHICPVADQCEARRSGLQREIPRIAARPKPSRVVEACVVAVHDGRVLVVRRAGPGLWEGFWEFPTVHREGPDPAGRAVDPPLGLERGVARLTGMEIVAGAMIQSLSYAVTRYRVRLDAYSATVRPRPDGTTAPAAGPGVTAAAWVEPARLGELTLSAAGRRIAAAIVAEPSAWGLATG